MADSKGITSKRQSTPAKKPAKPYPEFPLFAHQTRRWAKKIRGKLHYFGSWARVIDGKLERLPGDGWKEALALYKEQVDDLQAGRKPRPKRDGLLIVDLVNRFLTSKKHRLDSGELTARTFRDYHQTCEYLLGHFGKNRLVEDLLPEDFATPRVALTKTLGPVSLGNKITRFRMIFKFAYDELLIDRPVRYGQSFKKPSKRVLRLQRQKKGKRMFEAIELRRILDSAPQPLRAMILLAINGGFGQGDLSILPRSAIDFETGWCDFPRPKTGIERRCKLWTETIQAIQQAIENRHDPLDDSDDDLCFLTRTGRRWVKLNPNGKGTADDAVCKEFSKLLKKLDLKREGINFYALRHTFETVGGESRDQVAVNHIMGHVDSSMAGLYGEKISDERLQAVTDHVCKWLFKPAQSKTT